MQEPKPNAQTLTPKYDNFKVWHKTSKAGEGEEQKSGHKTSNVGEGRLVKGRNQGLGTRLVTHKGEEPRSGRETS